MGYAIVVVNLFEMTLFSAILASLVNSLRHLLCLKHIEYPKFSQFGMSIDIYNFTIHFCSIVYILAAAAEWAREALLGLGKGAPFSLCLTKKHFSEVASAHGKNEHHLSTVIFSDSDSIFFTFYAV